MKGTGSGSYTQKADGKLWKIEAGKAVPAGCPKAVMDNARKMGVRFAGSGLEAASAAGATSLRKAGTGSGSYSQKVDGKIWTIFRGQAVPPGTPPGVVEKARAMGVCFFEKGQKPENGEPMKVVPGKEGPEIVAGSSVSRKRGAGAKAEPEDEGKEKKPAVGTPYGK